MRLIEKCLCSDAFSRRTTAIVGEHETSTSNGGKRARQTWMTVTYRAAGAAQRARWPCARNPSNLAAAAAAPRNSYTCPAGWAAARTSEGFAEWIGEDWGDSVYCPDIVLEHTHRRLDRKPLEFDPYDLVPYFLPAQFPQ